MSIVNKKGFKVVLPRTGADEFWKLIHENYAGFDEHTWKYLAMLALRENAGWPLETISQVFKLNKGTISRGITNIKKELRDRFKLSPDMLSLPECNDNYDADFSNPDDPE